MQQALVQTAPRRGRWWVRAALVVALFALIGGLANVATHKPNPQRVTVAGIDDSQQIFGGAQQAGDRLGRSDAPIDVQFFTDLQAPTARAQFLDTVPPLVSGYVRPGRLKLELRHYSLGQAPEEAGFFGAEAAAQQGYAWQFTYLFFRNQVEAKRLGVNQDFMSSIAGAIPGIDVPRWQTYMQTQGAAMRQTLESYDKLGQRLGIRTLSPSVLVSGPAGTRTLQDGPSLGAIEQAIAAVG